MGGTLHVDLISGKFAQKQPDPQAARACWGGIGMKVPPFSDRGHALCPELIPDEAWDKAPARLSCFAVAPFATGIGINT